MINEKWNSIGGSDIAAIMGASPYATAWDVWARIKQGYQQTETPAMRRGKLFEPVLRTIATEDYGLKLLGPKDYRWSLESVPMRASIDDAVENDTDKSLEIIEYKTVSPFTQHNWSDGVPLHYQLQCQWYLAAAQASRAHVLALIGLDDVRHYVVEADIALQRRMIDAAIDFWTRYILGTETPAPGKSQLAKAYFDCRFPGEVSAPSVAGTMDDFTMMLKYQSRQRKIKELEEELDEVKNYFRERIGNATRLFVDLHAVTYSAAVQKFSVNWEAIAREFNPPH